MKLPDKLEWLRAYIDLAKRTVPTSRLRKMYIIPSSLDKRHKLEGCLVEIKKGKQYDIGIYLEYQEMTFSQDGQVHIQLKPYSKMDLVELLAHELAHLKHWEHTPDRRALQAKLAIKFAKQMKEEGYISEEDELARS